jgi:hypothetical protein
MCRPSRTEPSPVEENKRKVPGVISQDTIDSVKHALAGLSPDDLRNLEIAVGLRKESK